MSQTFSFKPDLSTDRDWVRWRISDTNCSDVLLYDETLDALLQLEGTKERAAAAAARSIAQGFARKVDITMGKLSIKWSQLAQSYEDRAKDIEREAGLTVAGPWAASISRSRKIAEREDDDRVPASFSIGMHDASYDQDGEEGIYGSTGDSWQ